jgi:hypothetical protein
VKTDNFGLLRERLAFLPAKLLGSVGRETEGEVGPSSIPHRTRNKGIAASVPNGPTGEEGRNQRVWIVTSKRGERTIDGAFSFSILPQQDRIPMRVSFLHNPATSLP